MAGHALPGMPRYLEAMGELLAIAARTARAPGSTDARTPAWRTGG